MAIWKPNQFKLRPNKQRRHDNFICFDLFWLAQRWTHKLWLYLANVIFNRTARTVFHSLRVKSIPALFHGQKIYCILKRTVTAMQFNKRSKLKNSNIWNHWTVKKILIKKKLMSLTLKIEFLFKKIYKVEVSEPQL